MFLYIYEGPVKSFDDILSDRWIGSTYAESNEKARSNLAYQYKKAHGLDRSANITLTGKIRRV